MATAELIPTKARQITRSGGFDLPCSADSAFPLFSAEGERLWIKEWNPSPIFPDTIEFRRDTLFSQGEGIERATWWTVDVDWDRHRAEYVRVAQESHAAHIVVKVEANGPLHCYVNVEYTVTSLTEDGERALQSFAEDAYAIKMRNWQRQIAEYLATQTGT